MELRVQSPICALMTTARGPDEEHGALCELRTSRSMFTTGMIAGGASNYTTRQKRVWMPRPANPGTRVRAPLPSLRPLQVLLVYGGDSDSVCYSIYSFLGRWVLVLVLRDLQRRNTILTSKYDFELEKRVLYAL